MFQQKVVGSNQTLSKLVFTASLIDVPQSKGQCEFTPGVVDKCAGDSWTRRPKHLFAAVSWPRQLGE